MSGASPTLKRLPKQCRVLRLNAAWYQQLRHTRVAMLDVRFDKFYRYEDLSRILHAYTKEFPHLVGIESIGKSYEGRDIWLMTVTCFATGS
ncbi:MAG: hypothetical protein LDL41_20705, partial [Coleofasciculus sp. S288]|nr:hypothetical protein [Coleofasciculus sp. S288]